MEGLREFWDFVTTAEQWWGSRGIATRTWAHVRISALAIVVAAALALPPALWLGHLRRGRFLAVTLANLGRALPSFGIIAVAFPLSISLGLGIGFWPTFPALVLLAIPPIFTNAYTGIRETDRSTVEAARGMGMQPRQVLWSVELPHAIPLLVGGVRIAGVQVVATAALGAFAGYQCLGSFVVEGLAQFDTARTLTGAFSIALLAVAIELGLGGVQRILTPWARAPAGPRRARRTAVEARPLALDA